MGRGGRRRHPLGRPARAGRRGLGRLLEAGQQVEALGFDGCYIFDHPAVQADPWVCLSALAGVTERVRLGSAVNCVPYRHPALVARMAADIDNISRGRFMLGLGIGWLKSEFEAFGASFDPAPQRFAALEEALEIIPGVWGPEKFAYEGQYYQIGPLQVTPPPLQQPRPPLADRRQRREADVCAWWRSTPTPATSTTSRHTERGLERVGGPELIGHKFDVRARLLRGAWPPLRRDPAHPLHPAPGPRPRTSAPSRRRSPAIGQRSSGSPATRRAQPSAFMTGTPEQVAAYYQSLVDVGAQYFVIQIDSGDTETIELLAREVVPRVMMAV